MSSWRHERTIDGSNTILSSRFDLNFGTLQFFWRSGMQKDSDSKCNTSTLCISCGETLKFQLSSTEKINIPVLTEPGKEIQINFSGKLPTRSTFGEPYFVLELSDALISMLLFGYVNQSKQEKVINFFETPFKLYRIREKMRSDKGSSLISEECRKSCRSKNTENDYCSSRLNTGSRAVKHATLKSFIINNVEDEINFTGI